MVQNKYNLCWLLRNCIHMLWHKKVKMWFKKRCIRIIVKLLAELHRIVPSETTRKLVEYACKHFPTLNLYRNWNYFELMNSESDEMAVLDLFIFSEDALPSHTVLSCQQTTSFASFWSASISRVNYEAHSHCLFDLICFSKLMCEDIFTLHKCKLERA